jgi:acetyl esterase/lipase
MIGAALALATLACGVGPASSAASGAWVKDVQPLPPQTEPPSFPLPVAQVRPGGQPEGWAAQAWDQRLVYNVSRPALIQAPSPLPPSQMAPAVLLVPGGGYLFMAMDNEGYDVAKRLSRTGVRVFIVKYRTLPIAGGYPGFLEALNQTFVRGERRPGQNETQDYAVADTQAAIRMMRSHAAEWHIDPAKVGVVGFSAGAVTVLAVTQANAPDTRPDFVGMIYGPTQGAVGLAKPPPLFAAIAADDRFFKSEDLSLIHSWRMAGASTEFHLYSGGGHGFASQPTNTTSDAWLDEFILWLQDSKILPGR